MISRSPRWSSLAFAAGWALCGLSSAADLALPANRARHVLRSDRLTVEVMDPNHPERYNRGSRFSPVANILQVTMDGRPFLFCPADHDPVLDNAGLAGEFDPGPAPGPPGFREAAQGEGFLKIGAGVLRKHGDVYDFFKTYEFEKPAKTEAHWTEDSASFRQVCSGVQGFAYELAAEIRVRNSSVVMTWRLTNTGRKSFSTEHYLHNFFSFDGAPVGPGYSVEFPSDIDSSVLDGSQPGTVKVEGGTIAFDRAIGSHVNLVVPGIKNADLAGAESSGRLEKKRSSDELRSFKTVHAPTGLQIRLASSLPVERVFLHATARYLCPEQFVRISLAPGGSAEWQWRYDFSVP